MLLFERQADASWLPTTVIRATPKRLQGKCLPGSPDRDARLASILQNALPPRINDFTEERGTFEDWISWGTYNLANGMTTWATEIKPEGTVDTLYEREVANVVASLPRIAPVSSVGRCNSLGQHSRRCAVVEGLARSGVQSRGDGIEVGLAVPGEVRLLREVLA